MKVSFTKDAEKQFKKLPKITQIAVSIRIRQIHAEQPIRITKLVGYKELYRSMVGQYRVVYRKFTNQLVVVLIGHRREVYKLLDKLLK